MVSLKVIYTYTGPELGLNMDLPSSAKHGRNIKVSSLTFVTEVQISFLLSIECVGDPRTTSTAAQNIRDLCFLDVRAYKFCSRKFLLIMNLFKSMKT